MGADSVAIATATDPSHGLLPIASTELEASHVLKDGAGLLYSLTVVIGATSGWVLLFDADEAPADGDVEPVWFSPLNSNGSNGALWETWAPGPPLAFQNGIVVVFSITGPFTKTASATAAFSAQIV